MTTAVQTLLEVGAAGAFLAAAVIDVRRRIIPNALCFALAAAATLKWLAAGHPVDGLLAFSVAALSLAGGFLLYCIRIIGAGDAKFFAAAAFWFGVGSLGAYMLALALATLITAAYSIATRRTRVRAASRPDLTTLPKNATLPYGVALGGAGIAALLLGC